jgi:hypothetical protein
MARTFFQDEAGYLSWRQGHPEGFVLNHDPRPRVAYLMLHRTSCRTLRGDPARGTLWTQAYAKTCADTPGELRDWARQKTGAEPEACGLCDPVRS